MMSGTVKTGHGKWTGVAVLPTASGNDHAARSAIIAGTSWPLISIGAQGYIGHRWRWYVFHRNMAAGRKPTGGALSVATMSETNNRSSHWHPFAVTRGFQHPGCGRGRTIQEYGAAPVTNYSGKNRLIILKHSYILKCWLPATNGSGEELWCFGETALTASVTAWCRCLPRR